MDSNKMLGSKKCKFFKEISKLKFELDTEKVQEDAKLDGYYVYETNLFDLEPKEIIQKYANQWKIENNFRILKSFLNIRPIFLRVDDHIYAHTLICFTSLVVLKLLIHKINKTMIDNGVLDEKLTEEKFIKLLNKVRERLDLNSKTKEILKRERRIHKVLITLDIILIFIQKL
ncbi:transposase [Mycoplasmopsis felis]|nr:transposase [Mycoplasmopsis felis]MCU9932939.1 transposase [Mycoplasmopsis cynos]UWV79017.1 transposase [Mycoplasmopsis felis]